MKEKAKTQRHPLGLEQAAEGREEARPTHIKEYSVRRSEKVCT